MNKRRNRATERQRDRGTRKGQTGSIRRHTDLDVYRRAFDVAMRIFEVTKTFPKDERYSLTDQIRRSSRSVCANVAEAWRKRRYQAAFISELGESEAEAAETQTWIQFAVECSYLPRDAGAKLYGEYDAILGMIVQMVTRPKDWAFR